MTDVRREIAADVAFEARSTLGESPIWDQATAELVWVDITAGTVNRWRPGSETQTTIALHGEVGSVALRSGGGYLVALGDRLVVVDPGQQLGSSFASLPCSPRTRLNDGKCDGAGRFWVGSMAYDERSPIGRLFRVEATGKVTTMLRGMRVSNGLDWSPDGSTMYITDSGTRSVEAYDFDLATGRLANPRLIIRDEGVAGVPDGLTVDADGCLWVAYWGGWRIRRYSPAGDAITDVTVPVGQVSSCTFGGPDLSELFITTAAVGLSDRDSALQSHAGSIFVARPNVQGRPIGRFAG